MMPAPPSHTQPSATLKTVEETNSLNTTVPPIEGDGLPKRSGELTDNEYGLILDATLRGKHRSDETILAFIDSYIHCRDVREASKDAGIHPTLGERYRARLDIQNAIQKLTDKSATKYGFDASDVMRKVIEIVNFDPIEMYNVDGTFKSNMHDISDGARRCLKKMKVKNIWGMAEDKNGIKTNMIVGEIIEYEFYDKMKAIELAGVEKEMFKTTTKVEHGLTKDMASILLESARRGAAASVEFKQPVTVDATVRSVYEREET